MQEKLAAIEEQSIQVQRRLDIITGLVWYASILQDATLRQKVQRLLEGEGEELNRESDKLTEMLEQLREKKKETHMRTLVTALLVIVMALLLISGVSAQELATNTPDTIESTATLVESVPVATEEATPPPESSLPPVDDGIDTGIVTVLPTALLVVIVLALTVVIVAGLLLIYVALQYAAKNYSPAIVTEIKGIVADTFDKGFQAAKQKAPTTASPWDDLLIEIGEPGVRRLITLLKGNVLTEPGIPTTPDNLPGAGGEVG